MSTSPQVLRFEEDDGRSIQYVVTCPRCGAEEVEQGPDHDHNAVTLQPDRDSYESPIGTRGGYVQIELACINGHRFSLISANHKGRQILGVVPE